MKQKELQRDAMVKKELALKKKYQEQQRKKQAADAHKYRLQQSKELIENLVVEKDGKWVPAFKTIKDKDGKIVYVDNTQ